MYDADRIVQIIGGVKQANGSYMCKCPVHDDQNASLHVTPLPGDVLIHCLAGCSQDSVFSAIRKLDSRLARPDWLKRKVSNSIVAAKKESIVVCKYPYNDEEGRMIYYVERREPKDFRMYMADGTPGIQNARKVPYNLDKIVKSQEIVITEGEKDADTVSKLGWCATTNHGGAGNTKLWSDADYNRHFKDKRLFILPDNDQAGRRRGSDLYSIFKRIADVRVCSVPTKYKDVTEWVEAESVTTDQFKQFLEQEEAISYSLNEKGKVNMNCDNVMRIIETHPQLKGHIWYDTFFNRVYTDTGNKLREWSDGDSVSLLVFIQRELGLAHFKMDAVKAAIAYLPRLIHRDSLVDWIKSLKWDGQKRVEVFLQYYFGAEDNAYVTNVSRCFLVGMIARALCPGCKLDTMMILEGEQGIFKSSALDALASPYFAEIHEKVDGKDFLLSIQGKWLGEIAELDSFSKADNTTIKQILSCRTDRFRMPYATYAEDYPRRCVFVGTTNKEDYLADETGSRRFWPVRCYKIKPDELRHDREQLFAEAKVMYENGVKWWDVPIEDAAFEQRKRLTDDPWEDKVLEYLQTHNNFKIHNLMSFIGIPLDQQDIRSKKRVSVILRKQNYWSKTMCEGNRTYRVWYRMGPPPDYDMES